MSNESLFFGAFFNISQRKFYSPWEIPPFGNLNNSNYNGLNTQRIDCVLISYQLENDIGAATNIQIRYQN